MFVACKRTGFGSDIGSEGICFLPHSPLLPQSPQQKEERKQQSLLDRLSPLTSLQASLKAEKL